MRHEETIEIDAAADAVWAVLEDVERWPEWTASMTSIRRLDEGAFGVGSSVRTRQPRFGEMTWTVTSHEPGRSFAWESRRPGAHTVAYHTVEPLEGGRSRVTLGIDQRGALAALIRPFIEGRTKRYVAMEAEGLKRRAEERQGATAEVANLSA